MKINNLKMFLYIFKIFFYFRKFVTGHIEYLRRPYVTIYELGTTEVNIIIIITNNN
jgi:hypothetical protein